jgi:hypothetical protein
MTIHALLDFEVCIFQKWLYTVAETEPDVKDCAAKTDFAFQKTHSAVVSHYLSLLAYIWRVADEHLGGSVKYIIYSL